MLSEPYALIGVAALAAEEEHEARRQVLTGALSMVRLRTGRPGLVPSPEEAEAYRFNELERGFVDSWLGNVVHGTPDAVRQGLDELAKRTGADELMITANAHGGAARRGARYSYAVAAAAVDSAGPSPWGVRAVAAGFFSGAGGTAFHSPRVRLRGALRRPCAGPRRAGPRPVRGRRGGSRASPGRCRSRSGGAARPARRSPRTRR